MTIAMGLATNYPLAIASGMGINAIVAFQLVAALKLPWTAAMGVVLLEGLAITVLVLTGFREAIMHAIPVSMKRSIGVGIGLSILFIGLGGAGIVKPGPPGVPVTLGDLTATPVAVALFGLLLTVWLTARRSSGALLVGILVSTGLAIAVNAVSGGRAFPIPGQAVWPAALVAMPDFSSLGAGFDFSVFVRLGVITALVTIFSLMLSDFFDTMGTVIGIGGGGGGPPPRRPPAPLQPLPPPGSLGPAAGGGARALPP